MASGSDERGHVTGNPSSVGDMSAAEPVHHSPLHERHEAAGAKFAPFAGWLMPLEYTGVRSEHTAVRTAVGLFDVSHLGTLEVRGSGVVTALNSLFTNDLSRIGLGQAQYTMLCDDAGVVVDDLIVYLLGDDVVLLIPNAANSAAVAAAVREAVGSDAEVSDLHHDRAIIAVQGPAAGQVLTDAGVSADLDYMQVARAQVGDVDVIVCRTGYTGELGYELVVPARDAVAVWGRLVVAGGPHALALCGLGARDTLRTEMGYPLHGQDLGGEFGPVETGMGWAVGWGKDEFRGRSVLMERRASGLVPRLRGLVMIDRGVPRAGMAVHLMPEGPQVGTLTSGTFSPTLGCGVALGVLDRTVTPGDEVSVNVRGRWLSARVTATPLVESHVRA